MLCIQEKGVFHSEIDYFSVAVTVCVWGCLNVQYALPRLTEVSQPPSP